MRLGILFDLRINAVSASQLDNDAYQQGCLSGNCECVVSHVLHIVSVLFIVGYLPSAMQIILLHFLNEQSACRNRFEFWR